MVVKNSLILLTRGVVQLNVFLKIIEWCKEHQLFSLCSILILIIFFPILVFLLYDVIPTVVKPQITANGLLGYFGAVLSSSVALSIAIVGAWRDKKREEEAEDLRINNRRKEISPNFHIDFQLNEKGYFDVTITNCGKYTASDIYFIDKNVCPFIKSGKSQTIRVCFDYMVDVKNAYYYECELDEDYPKSILLIYSDVDSNIVCETFNHLYEDSKHLYISSGPEYEG